MIINSNLFKMKNKILPSCSQENYRDSLGEFANRSYMACLGLTRLNGYPIDRKSYTSYLMLTVSN